MSPIMTFHTWWKTLGHLYCIKLCDKNIDRYFEYKDQLKQAFLDGYELANHPIQETKPCYEKLPLVALGPDSACRP